VNNAGIERHGSLLEMPDEEFDRMIAVNLRGVFNGIKRGGAAMVTSGGGAIVNVASLAALGGMPLFGAYRAAKAGVVQLTRTAALELRDAKVRVNAILPGFIRTPLRRTERRFSATLWVPTRKRCFAPLLGRGELHHGRILRGGRWCVRRRGLSVGVAAGIRARPVATAPVVAMGHRVDHRYAGDHVASKYRAGCCWPRREGLRVRCCAADFAAAQRYL
jgi:NAD(P)-dependent dehydrogenase (short-subunit alcohol dehydrogenase family)